MHPVLSGAMVASQVQVRGAAIHALGMRALHRFGDLLLPPLCLACRSPVSGHDGLCTSCWPRIDFIEPPVCDRLGIPLPYATDEVLISAGAMADPPVYDRARAVARYDGVMRDLIHNLKFRDRHDGTALFGRWLSHAGRGLLPEADLIVPVPLYALRLWSRRFNQAALLAGVLSRISGVPNDPFVLSRIRRTASQVGLSAEQRKRNVRAAFAVAESTRPAIAGKRIVLIDDVITTGATANACARALKRAGAVRVDVLALARVVDPLTPSL